jgi:DNA-binding transcriptional MocR family regulator
VSRLTVKNGYNRLRDDGLIESVVGRGTFVSRAVKRHGLNEMFGKYLTPSGVFNDVYDSMNQPNMRSMGLAIADRTLFPADEFWSCLTRLRPQAHDLLHYGPIAGDPELRVAIAKLLREQKIDAVASQVLITNGAMQALNLVTRAFTKPGDVVLVEETTFLAVLDLFKTQGLQVITVSMDQDGVSLEQLEQILRCYRPRLYYTIPTFHNPTGISFSLPRREALVELAHQYGLLLVEDEIYNLLSYDMPPPPPLQAFSNPEHVIYVSSLSKMLMPGLRLGYIHAAPTLLKKLTAMRHVSDLCGPPMIQRAAAHFIEEGGLKRHLKRVLPIYQGRRNTMMQALQTYMPEEVSWTEPQGGYCCWLTMPRYFAPGDLYRTAWQQGIAITAGEAFSTEKPEEEHFRLCFGNETREVINAGIRQLAQIIKKGPKRPKDTGLCQRLPLV